MKALRALLHASPRYFQVYKTFSMATLLHVAWNQITPDVVPIALNALERRDNSTQPFASQKTVKGPHEIPYETWKRLLCFHEIVESFISAYTSSRLVLLENFLHPQTHQTSLSLESSSSPEFILSQLEYARLARAFYNLDLYGNLFNDLVTSWLSWLQAGPAVSKRAMKFLQSLRDWELDELLCVQSYMIERLKVFLNKFDDGFMEAFLKEKPYIVWPAGLTQRTTQLDLLSEESYQRLQPEWMEGCLTRGLEKLLAIFSTDTLLGKFNLLGEIDRQDKYINRALNRIPNFSELELAERVKSPEIGFDNNLNQPNEAWFWAIKFCQHPRIRLPPDVGQLMTYEGSDSHFLEPWGYVFWDHERLERLGMLTKRYKKKPPKSLQY